MTVYEKTEVIMRENIKRLRKQEGYSVEQMAKFIGVDSDFYEEFEDSNLYKKLSIGQLEDICDLFGVTVQMITGDKDITPIEYKNYAGELGVEGMTAVASINRIAKNIREMNSLLEKNNSVILDFVSANIEDRLQELSENELGILLLKREEIDDDTLLDVLGTMLETERAVSHFVGSKCYVYRILPLYYVDKPNDLEDVDLTKARASAVWTLFDRWTAAGYNRNNAKKPYGSKAFTKYMTEIGFLRSDYMLVLVDPEEK